MDVSAGVYLFIYFSIRGVFVELEEEMKSELFDVSVKKEFSNNLN